MSQFGGALGCGGGAIGAGFSAAQSEVPAGDDDADYRPPPVEVGADEVSLQALQVDPQGVQNFFASRARAPLDLQVTFDTVSVQLERLITSHREMMASLQTVQAEQAVLKREMESRR